jgi:hypothetical protein
MTDTGYCLVCDHNARMDELPPREVVAFDEHWRVAHAFGTGTPGWLVLAPRRHVTAVAELTDAEAATLGAWQVRLSRALHAVTGCGKTYIAQFAEARGSRTCTSTSSRARTTCPPTCAARGCSRCSDGRRATSSAWRGGTRSRWRSGGTCDQRD